MVIRLTRDKDAANEFLKTGNIVVEKMEFEEESDVDISEPTSEIGRTDAFADLMMEDSQSQQQEQMTTPTNEEKSKSPKTEGSEKVLIK